MCDICCGFSTCVKDCYDRALTKNETWLDEIMAVWFSGYAYTLTSHICANHRVVVPTKNADLCLFWYHLPKCQNVMRTTVSSQRDRWYLNSTHKMNVYVLVIRSRGSCNSWRWNGLRATQLKIKITRRRLGVFWGWSFSFSVDGSIESSTMSCQVVSDETCGTFKLPWKKSSLDDYYCDWNEIPWEIC